MIQTSGIGLTGNRTNRCRQLQLFPLSQIPRSQKQSAYTYFVEYYIYKGVQNQPSPYANFTAGNNRMNNGSYDKAGNLLSDGTNNYLYDAEGRLCATQQPALTGGGMTGDDDGGRKVPRWMARGLPVCGASYRMSVHPLAHLQSDFGGALLFAMRDASCLVL
jgi:hypothetical protein